MTLSTVNDKRILAFLDMAVHINEQRLITFKWYQKTHRHWHYSYFPNLCTILTQEQPY